MRRPSRQLLAKNEKAAYYEQYQETLIPHNRPYTRIFCFIPALVKHANDPRPIDPTSPCPAARDYSRAYLHHLLKAGEILAMMLMTSINLAYYQEFMASLRRAVEARRFEDFRAETKALWAEGERSA